MPDELFEQPSGRGRDALMPRMLIDFWVRPSFDNYAWVNLTFYATSLCLGAFLGSLVSVFVVSGGVYATLHLLTGRLKWALPRPVGIVCFAFAGLFVADLISALIHPSQMVFGEVFANLTFLGFAGIYSITFVDRERLLNTVETVAALASLLAIPAIFLVIGYNVRSEMATGNSSVLALLAGILYLLNIGAADRRWSRSSLIHLAAAASAGYLIVLSGTRAMWLVLVLLPLLSLVFHHPLKRVLIGLPVLLVLFAGSAVLLASFSQTFASRVNDVVREYRSVADGNLSGSIGQRIRLYEAGYALALERPIFGYGPGNERQEMASKTAELSGEGIAFSHAHNAVLNMMLRSGVLGLAALTALVILPLVVASRARKDDIGEAGFFILIGIMVVYLSSGLVGLMLGHDIHDSVFVAGLCFSLYLVFGRAEAPETDRT